MSSHGLARVGCHSQGALRGNHQAVQVFHGDVRGIRAGNSAGGGGGDEFQSRLSSRKTRSASQDVGIEVQDDLLAGRDIDRRAGGEDKVSASRAREHALGLAKLG